MAERAAMNGLAADVDRAQRERKAGMTLIRRGWDVIGAEAKERARAVRIAPGERADLADILG